MESEAGCPLPDRFPSRPGMVFPLFHVFADAERVRGRRGPPEPLDRPLAVDGLALGAGPSAGAAGQLHAEPVTVIRDGLGPPARIRRARRDERSTRRPRRREAFRGGARIGRMRP